MSEQISPIEILLTAMERAQKGDWREVQELCAELGNHPPPIGPVARLNILICQYHLGFTQQVPQRALPLLSHLPVTGWLPCLGLVLLAARKNGELARFKPIVMSLADPVYQAWDLPTVPTFVMLQPEKASCLVIESTDAALMSEIVQGFLSREDLSEDERAKLQSLADRYLERAVTTAARRLQQNGTPQPQRPWWKFW
jgi:hypothetical protein